jgi:hypothetical protein
MPQKLLALSFRCRVPREPASAARDLLDTTSASSRTPLIDMIHRAPESAPKQQRNWRMRAEASGEYG